ncbi:hypothetical protein Fot_24230 [Forsythia ovata]|uniref:Uncharacterized protein n=1 Tax=Forsythia ovata TaxID=205694 RepID=A0ABD1U5P6_9LAMI
MLVYPTRRHRKCHPHQFLQDSCLCLGAPDNRGKGRHAPRAGRKYSRLPRPILEYEYINIGSHWDELDPTVLEKLPPPATKAAASDHKYWTSVFGKAADNVELTELLKLVEMYTSRSHVLNCELYRLLEMKVDELRSITGEGEGEDVEALRAENKDLRG